MKDLTQRSAGLKLRTPEGVTFSMRLASPILRMAALVIDWMVVGAAWSILAVSLVLVKAVSRDLAGAAAMVGFFLFSQGYRIATEWLWRGQSLGKRIMKLRVVDARGLRLTFAQVVIRNLLRFIDALPGAYAVGGIAALVNARGQRLGDVVADTLVVWEPAEVVPDLGLLPAVKYNSLRQHAPVIARLRQVVTPIEARVAWQALRRRDRMDDTARLEVFGDLAAHFRTRASLPEEIVGGLSDEQIVRNVIDVLFAAPRVAGSV
jgi:uncharacterized RDD family membrane protein YckC